MPPKGFRKHKPNGHAREIIVDASVAMSRQHGEIRQLLQEYTEKARAFFIVDQVLTQRTAQRAIANGPAKLLAAANLREEHGGKKKRKRKSAAINGRGVIARFISDHYGAVSRKLPREHTKADIARGLLTLAQEQGLKTTFGSLAQGVYLFRKTDASPSANTAH